MNTQFDDLEMNNDEFGETIEGEGCERHVTYYIGDHLVQLDLCVLDEGSLYIHRDDRNCDGGESDRIIVPNIQQLMSILGVQTKEDIIDALIEKCKTIDCLLDWDKFIEFLQKNNLQYSQKELGSFEPDFDESGASTLTFIPNT